MSERHMIGAVLVEPRRFKRRQLPIPVPTPGQARIRLQGCGVCASSLPLWQGRSWFQYPREAGAPGHEGWGIVDAVGSEAGAELVGQRVGFLSDRAFAQYDVASVESLVRIPDSIAGDFPAEPLGCAMNVFRRSDIQPEQSVAIIGIGLWGHC